MKRLVFILALALTAGNASAALTAWTQGSNPAQVSTAANYERAMITASDGWIWYCLRHNAGDESLVLNGSSGDMQGYIKSPLYSNGCRAISFWYYKTSTNTSVRCKLEIVQAGAVVYEQVLTPTERATWYQASFDDISIDGEYQVVITNISNTSAQATAQLVVQLKDIRIMGTIPAHTYQIHAPKEAQVYVGKKDQSVVVAGNYLYMHYVPFTEKAAAAVQETDTSRIWYYNLSGQHNFRISMAGGITQVGLFTPRSAGAVDTSRTFTAADMAAHAPSAIDHDVNHLAGRNVADIYLNINAAGHLRMALSDTFQIVHERNWQAINTDVDNYFIEPDYHYYVLNENGQPSNAVISISSGGVIHAHSAGTAIVLVSYDAMVAHHTANVGSVPAFFSALWAENTGVFVVSIAQSVDDGMRSNMAVNPYWSAQGNDRLDTFAIDAEHDVLYYEASKGSFHYTFRPDGVSQVDLAVPILDDNLAHYVGFGTDSVISHSDGSYTLKLSMGRNIVRMTSPSGSRIYQVLTAKPAAWSIENVSHSGQALAAGDTFAVVFNTIYHPAGKLAGIYNMSAGIQYTGFNTDFPLILGPGQYTFASRAQRYQRVIPQDYDGDEVALTNGTLKVNGFGSHYGAHRGIMINTGVPPNLNASIRLAYCGVLPDIIIPLSGAVDGISVDRRSVSMHIGDTIAVNASISPADARNRGVVWTSSNPNAAIVLPDGKIIAVGIGNAVIIAANASNGRFVDTCNVSVLPTFVSSIALNHTEDTLGVGATLQLHAYVLPANATNGGIVWSSSNDDVARVDNDGLVRTFASGEALIAAAAADGGGASAVCRIVVSITAATGINTDAKSPVVAFPNPFSSYISVQSDSDSQAVLYNSIGMQVMSIDLRTGSNIIAASWLPSGIYILKVGIFNVKLLKMSIK
jgi:hypothetical protein